MTKISNILYLCAGNTCRSPFAEAYSKWLQKNRYKEELKDVLFDSAGIYHYYETPQLGTVNYLKSKGIDISGFQAKKIEVDLLKKQDLILAFEQKYHVNKLKRKFKNFKDLDKKVFLLMEYVGETEDLEIEDPFYMEEKEYRKVMERIEEGVRKAIEKIIIINNNEV